MPTTQTAPLFIALYGLICVVAAGLAYGIAAAKHREAGFWATLAFVLPPAVLFTLFLTPASSAERQRKQIEKMLHREVHRMED